MAEENGNSRVSLGGEPDATDIEIKHLTEDEITSLTEALTAATHELGTIRGNLTARIHDLRDAFASFTDVNDQMQTASEHVQAFCESLSTNGGEVAAHILQDYDQGLLDFLHNDSHAIAEKFAEDIDHGRQRLEDLFKEELDQKIHVEILQLRSVLHEACASLTAKINEGADEMTGEIGSFKPVLHVLESCVQPVIDAVNQVKDLAHSVGLG